MAKRNPSSSQGGELLGRLPDPLQRLGENRLKPRGGACGASLIPGQRLRVLRLGLLAEPHLSHRRAPATFAGPAPGPPPSCSACPARSRSGRPASSPP